MNFGQYIRKFMKRSVKNNTTSAIDQLEKWLKRPTKDINGVKYAKTKSFKIWKLTQYSSKPGAEPKVIKAELISEFDNNKINNSIKKQNKFTLPPKKNKGRRKIRKK